MRYLALLAALLPGVAVAQTYGPGPNTGYIPSLKISPVGVGITSGNQTPVAGSAMKIDLLSQSGSFPLQPEAGIWNNEVYTFFGISKEFNASSTPNPATGLGPVTSLFTFANNNGSVQDVDAIIGDCVTRVAGGTCFGANFIARSSLGGSGASKLVGTEIDVEPAAGETVSAGSGGLFLNAFSTPIPTAVLTGSLGGGSWTNGIVLGSVTGTGLSPQTSSSMASFIDTTNGTYSTAAIRIGNQQVLRFDGSDANPCTITTDNNRFLQFNGCTNGYSFKVAGINVWLIGSNGNLISGNSGVFVQHGATNSITAHAGGGQGSATALASEVNRVATVATAADSVKLPTALVGMCVVVTDGDVNAMQLFGNGSDTINDVAAATGVSVPAGKTGQWCSPVAGKWYGGTFN